MRVFNSLILIILTQIALSCNPALSAPDGSLVAKLPGFNGSFPSKHYSVYVKDSIFSPSFRLDSISCCLFYLTPSFFSTHIGMSPSMRRNCITILWRLRGIHLRILLSSGSMAVRVAQALMASSTSMVITPSSFSLSLCIYMCVCSFVYLDVDLFLARLGEVTKV